jgi:hypothetical protein
MCVTTRHQGVQSEPAWDLAAESCRLRLNGATRATTTPNYCLGQDQRPDHELVALLRLRASGRKQKCRKADSSGGRVPQRNGGSSSLAADREWRQLVKAGASAERPE